MDSPIMIRLAGLTPQKAIFFGLLLLGVFYISLYDDGAEIEAAISVQETQLVEERAKAETTRKLLADLETLRNQVQNMGENLKIALAKLPTELNSFRLVRDIQKIARAAGVEIKSIKPSDSQINTFYEEIPVEVSLSGQYKDLVTFLYYVSGLERITRIRTFTISSDQKGEERGGEPILKMNTEVVSFRYIPGAEKEDDSVEGAVQQ